MDLRLYGRGPVVTFVKEAVKRDGVPGRPLPIVFLTGPRGSGGTVLLKRLWDECAEDVPSAHIDLASAQELSDVVLAIMQGLQRGIIGIRSIAFPRLSLAFKALAFVDDGDGRASFDSYMRAGGAAARVNSALPVWTDRAAQLLQSTEQQVLAVLAAQVLGGLLSGIDHRKDRKGLSWHAANGISRGGSDYDPLWELHDWQHQGTEAAERKVGKTLCAALLADLRTDFNDPSILHRQRTANCLLLLDDADDEIGELLLDLFDECRRESVGADESGDPLVVVAVQRGCSQAPAGTPIASTDGNLRFARFNETAEDWWCPVRLTDLSRADVLNMTKSSMLGSSRRDADFVHALTGGHPLAAGYLTAFLAQTDEPASVRPLLDRDSPTSRDPRHPPLTSGTTSGTTVEDHLLARVFADDLTVGPGADAAAVCAATPGLRHAACQATYRFLGWPQVNAVEVRAGLAGLGWLDDEHDPPRLHPLAALLFWRRLAHDPGLWREVHRGYVVHYARPNDEALRHHHELAQVEPSLTEHLGSVISYLEEALKEYSADHWLTIFTTITGAPNQVRTTRDPRVVVTTIAGTTEPGSRRRVIARLTVARWLFNDRHLDPSHRLAKVIANEYDNLAQLSTPDGEPFYRESATYRAIEREWED